MPGSKDPRLKGRKRCYYFTKCLNYDRSSDLCNELLGIREDGTDCERKEVVAKWHEKHKEKYG